MAAANARTDNPERAGHCQRVAYLCWRLASNLRLPDSIRNAMLLAASEHEGEAGANSDLVCVNSGDRAAASEILLHWRGFVGPEPETEVRLAAQVLEICDDFDDAVEMAALDRLSAAEAIAGFGSEAGYDPKVLEALRQMVCLPAPLQLNGKLPVLPAAGTKLLKGSEESATVVGLEAIAASDPVLAATLIGTANSAYFGSRSTIRHLRDAILRVGVPFARKILIAACFGRVFASSSLRDLWNHSRMVAAVAYEMAGAAGHDPDAAYVAGLVHDIGRLITQTAAGGSRVSEDTFLTAGFPLVYAESVVYGADHAEAGARLLKSWGLPDDIVEAVRFHHRPESTDSPLAGILFLAEEFCAEQSGVSETLSAAMRKANACLISGSQTPAGHRPDREAAIFALAS